MRRRRLADVAGAVGGGLADPSTRGVEVIGAAADSRRVRPGDLFVALRGERSDGHAYLDDAARAGATAAMVAPSHDRPASPIPAVEVDDPGTALLALARDERSALRGTTVVGVTGSTGKTCTKDLTAAVLSSRFRVKASLASFNNEVGLPLTVLSADETTDVLVCEMGARGVGHIRLLCDVARPDVGIVTNVGVAHMELFGSRDALVAAKAELPEALPADGTAVLNADDVVVRGYAARTQARVVLYGTGDGDVRAERVTLDPTTGAARFVLVTPDGRADVALRVPGEHIVPDALAAAATGWAQGVDAEAAAAALRDAEVSAGRMEVFTIRDVRVIDDSYNANPTSMAAALRSAKWMAGRGRCVAVLGVMAELGPISRDEHERMGELVARLGIDELVVVGPEARLLAAGALREGVEPERVHAVDDADGAVDAVRRLARPGDVVLVKASRSARLERVARALRDDGAGADDALGGAA